MDLSITQILLVFGAGMASVLSPCVLPVLPIIVVGTEKDHKYRPLLIVAGISLAFMLMGVITSLFGYLIAGKMQYVEKIAGGLIILFGILLLFDVNVFKKMSFLQKLQHHSRGRWSGFFLGLTLGVIWIPCIGPILSGILAMVAAEKLLTGIFLLLVYALGFSIPMLLVAYGSQFSRERIGLLKAHPIVIRGFGGSILVLLGTYIITNGIVSLGW